MPLVWSRAKDRRPVVGNFRHGAALASYPARLQPPIPRPGWIGDTVPRWNGVPQQLVGKGQRLIGKGCKSRRNGRTMGGRAGEVGF